MSFATLLTELYQSMPADNGSQRALIWICILVLLIYFVRLMGRLLARIFGRDRPDTSGAASGLRRGAAAKQERAGAPGTAGTGPDLPHEPSIKQRQAGELAEMRVQRKLRELKGKVINGYIKSENIFFARHNFEIDFLLLVPNVGLIVTEVKNWSGDIYPSSGTTWRQVRSGGQPAEIKNPSLQVLRTAELVRELLSYYKIDQWPIHTLVLVANRGAAVHISPDDRPQSDVIKEHELTTWINSRPKQEHLRFSRTDHERIRGAIKAHEELYPWEA